MVYVQGVTLWRRQANGSWGQIASGLAGDDDGARLSLQSRGNGWPALRAGETYQLDLGGGVVKTLRLLDDDGRGTITFG